MATLNVVGQLPLVPWQRVTAGCTSDDCVNKNDVFQMDYQEFRNIICNMSWRIDGLLGQEE